MKHKISILQSFPDAITVCASRAEVPTTRAVIYSLISRAFHLQVFPLANEKYDLHRLAVVVVRTCAAAGSVKFLRANDTSSLLGWVCSCAASWKNI